MTRSDTPASFSKLVGLCFAFIALTSVGVWGIFSIISWYPSSAQLLKSSEATHLAISGVPKPIIRDHITSKEKLVLRLSEQNADHSILVIPESKKLRVTIEIAEVTAIDYRWNGISPNLVINTFHSVIYGPSGESTHHAGWPSEIRDNVGEVTIWLKADLALSRTRRNKYVDAVARVTVEQATIPENKRLKYTTTSSPFARSFRFFVVSNEEFGYLEHIRTLYNRKRKSTQDGFWVAGSAFCMIILFVLRPLTNEIKNVMKK